MISLGNDPLFEVPLSRGLYIGSHEGLLFIYHKKSNMLFDDDASYYNCIDVAPYLCHLLASIDYSGLAKEYYFDDDLIRLTYKFARNYEDQDISSFECSNCLIGDNKCPCYSGAFPRHIDDEVSNRLIDDWWTLDDVLTVKEPIILKEFDPLQSHYGLFLMCKIKNIGTPKMNSKFKRYEQKITVYDDHSKKQIKSLIIGDDVFFEDEFEKGDYVLVIGDYFKSHSIPYKIHKIKHLEGTTYQDDVPEEWHLKYHAYMIWDNDVILQEKSQNKSNNSSVSRNSSSYNAWKDNVLTRDKVCQCCGGDKYPEVHHIFGYKDNESLRENPENGIVLCKWCHKKYHSYYGKKANPLDLVDFLNRFGTKRDD